MTFPFKRAKNFTVERLILHVGPPKTGSTAIQSALHLNRERLLLQGVFVPVNEVLPGQHGSVLRKFYPEGDFAKSYPWDSGELDIDKILAEMSDLECDTLVLSSEQFSTATVIALGKLLASIEPRQVLVVVGLRPALENAASSFAEMLKDYDPGRKRHDSFIDNFEKGIAPRWENGVVTPFLSEWRAQDGEASLDVLVFASGIDVLSLFEQATGLALPDRDNLQLNERKSICTSRMDWAFKNFIRRSYVTVSEQSYINTHAIDGFVHSSVPEHVCDCAELVSAEDTEIIDKAFRVYRDRLLESATRVWGDPSCLDGAASRTATIPRYPDETSHDLMVKMLLGEGVKSVEIFRDMAEGNEFWQETSRKHEEAAEYWRRQYEELAGR